MIIGMVGGYWAIRGHREQPRMIPLHSSGRIDMNRGDILL